MKLSAPLAVVFGLLASPASFASEAKTLTFLFEDAHVAPWNYPDGTGVDVILLKMVDERLDDVKFSYQAVPWKRCLIDTEKGQADGCFSASYKEERKVHGVFPMKGDRPDAEFALHMARFSLFAEKQIASTVKVDGLKIEGLPKGAPLAVPAGYSIAADLAKEGYVVDSDAKEFTANFQKTIHGRAVATVALTDAGNVLLKDFPKLTRVDPPLVEKSQFLLLSHKLAKNDAALVEKIFKTIRDVRESQEFKDKAAQFIAVEAPLKK